MSENAEFEWDPEKAAANERKHGVTFPFAARVFRDANRRERLDPGDYDGEERWITTGRAGEFLLVVVYTVRGESIRIISARRAERNEERDYWFGEVSS